MRIVERIPLFLSRVNLDSILLKLWHTTEDQEEAVNFDSIIEFVYSDTFKDYWTSNPDLRFGQAMVNLGYNIFDPLYHKEEYEVLMLCGYSRPESYIWGSNYNEDGSVREKTLYRFIDELGDKHLATMVDEANDGVRYYDPTIVEIFCEELHRRGFVNYKLTDKGLNFMLEKKLEYLLMMMQ